MDKQIVILLIGLAVVAALPHQTVFRKLDSDLRYQYERDGNGLPHLVDLWETIVNMVQAARFNPDTQNVYHLFTRNNPSVSQVLVPGNDALVLASNFNATRRTAILIHGWMANATSIFNAVLLPAFLDAEDMNVIVVDWCAGACTFNYPAALRNVISSGASVARFITWLSNTTGADPTKFHVAGHSLGGQQSGIVGRNLDGQIEYITSLDPAANGWANNNNKFRATDGMYTEVIHTNIEASGYLTPLGDVDFYPNGGDHMPGCSSNACNHDRCFFYLAESLRSGGFTGRRCSDYQAALVGNCTLAETLLPLGGLTPKFGAQGVYYLETNASPPFSRG